MTNKLPRITVVVIANVISFYIISIITFLIASALTGSDPKESGLLMISPLAFMIFGMILPAIFSGIVSGFFINIFWGYAAKSNLSVIRFSVILGLTFAFVLVFSLFSQSIFDRSNPNTFAAMRGAFVVSLFASVVCVTSNLISTALAKSMFPNDRLS